MKKIVIEKENIIYNLDVKNAEEVIVMLSEKLYANGKIADKNQFIESVFERENQIPTSIGNEIAIPHGKSSSVINSTIALAVLKDSIKWSEKSDDYVKYIFLLSIKDSDSGDYHLRTLANLSSELMREEFVHSFKEANSQEELFKVINHMN